MPFVGLSRTFVLFEKPFASEEFRLAIYLKKGKAFANWLIKDTAIEVFWGRLVN